jgi:hypothetical protein
MPKLLSTISTLWQECRLPLGDGLYRAAAAGRVATRSSAAAGDQPADPAVGPEEASSRHTLTGLRDCKEVGLDLRPRIRSRSSR